MIRFYKFSGLNSKFNQAEKIREEASEHMREVYLGSDVNHDKQVEELMDVMQACFNQLLLICDTPDKLQRADALHNVKMQQRRAEGRIELDDSYEGRMFVCKLQE